MQKLEIFQSLWAMELRRPDGKERSIEESFAMVAEAGFAGIGIDLVAKTDIFQAQNLKHLYERHGLGCSINAFPNTIEELRPVLHMAKDLDARFVNVIGRVMPISVQEMIPVVQAWIAMSAQEGVAIRFETHRNCITNDLFTILQLLDAIPELSLCADLSHVLVDREFWYPISSENNGYIRRLLERSECFQGRVGSREQIQVQLSFSQHKKWFDVFAGWWEDGFRLWRQRSEDDAVLNFLCELGPAEYAITGSDGFELSDRWEETLILRRRVEAIWANLDSERKLDAG